MDAIEIDHLRKDYGARIGIENVSFTVPAATMFGFIGPNGAGKTTTIRILLGLLAPTSGAARIFGVDVGSPRARTGVGYVAGEPQLYPRMRVGKLLAFLGRFHPGDHAARRRALADQFELDLDAPSAELSLGNRKKVAIAAALQHAPRLVILDEPTSGLDPIMRARLHDRLRAEVAGGTTVVVSSHVLADIQAVCERVAIVNHGRVVAIDDVRALRRRELRRVRAAFEDGRGGDILAGLTQRLAGLQGFERCGNRIAFLYRGDMPTLLDALAAAAPSDVQIEEASLEDVFLADFATPKAVGHVAA